LAQGGTEAPRVLSYSGRNLPSRGAVKFWPRRSRQRETRRKKKKLPCAFGFSGLLPLHQSCHCRKNCRLCSITFASFSPAPPVWCSNRSSHPPRRLLCCPTRLARHPTSLSEISSTATLLISSRQPILPAALRSTSSRCLSLALYRTSASVTATVLPLVALVLPAPSPLRRTTSTVPPTSPEPCHMLAPPLQA
jgi:hypothetical protein